MKALLICKDRPGALTVRGATRAAHPSCIAATGVAELAGPTLGNDGNPDGRLIALDVPGLHAACARPASDPCALAELFGGVTVHGWRRVVG